MKLTSRVASIAAPVVRAGRCKVARAGALLRDFTQDSRLKSTGVSRFAGHTDESTGNEPILIFDLDGTLVETAPDLRNAVNVMLTGAGRDAITLDETKNMIGDGMRTLMDRAFEATGGPPEGGKEELDERFAVLNEVYNKACCEETYAYDNVLETLEQLQAQHHPMCVCTNKPQIPAEHIMNKLDLMRFFSAVVGGDFCPVRKPDPGHLLLAAEMADSRGDGSRGKVMIGDGHNDVKVAHNAGVPVVALTYGYSRVPLPDLKPTVLIDRFDEIPQALISLMDNPSY